MAYVFQEACFVTCCFLLLQTCVVLQGALDSLSGPGANVFKRNRNNVMMDLTCLSFFIDRIDDPMRRSSKFNSIAVNRVITTLKTERPSSNAPGVETELHLRQLANDVRKTDPTSLYFCSLNDELGCMLTRTKQYQEAERVFEEALALVRKKIPCHQSSPGAPDGQVDAAFKSLEIAAFLERDYGLLLMQTGRTDRARKMIGEANAVDDLAIKLQLRSMQSDY